MRIRWICVSEACHREVEVQIQPSDMARQLPSPTCTCGGAMKKVYSTPTFRRLSEDEASQVCGNRESGLGKRR